METNLFGTYLTKSFSDIFPDFDTVKEAYDLLPSKMKVLSQDDLEFVFMLLMGEYKNSHISSLDEDQFILKFFTKTYEHAPVYLKRTEILKTVRELNMDEIQQGSTAVYNHAYNPGVTGTSTQDATELTFINDQNTTKYKKSKPEAIAEYLLLLKQDPTSYFIEQYKDLFITIVEPYNELIYYGE